MAGDADPGRVDNGLRAPAYVPLTDVDTETGRRLLAALGRARIAAYLGPTPHPGSDQLRLFVSSDDRVDARTIVATLRALGPADGTPADPLAGVDTDVAFQELIAGWHVDTVSAVREAERDLSREDAEWRARLMKPPASDEVWLDEDHYVPPPPPPLPRLAAPTVLAMIVLALSVGVLAFGGYLGLTGDLTLVLGIGGLLTAGGILFSRLREQRDEDDEDDGSAV
jgi:hypothetical protein